jgi:release factor glutamine methyltransferase
LRGRLESHVAMRIADALREGSRDLGPVDLYYLLGFILGKDKCFLLSHPELELSLPQRVQWRRVKRRRMRGVPAAYLTGEREFYGMSFRVNRHTLIPRPETELLVDEVRRRNPASVLDLGTGSGCITIALARHLPRCRITAVDISRKALGVARRNARRLVPHRPIDFVHGDFLSGLEERRYEIIVSNPPYVREGDVEVLDPSVAAYEPHGALYAGPDGLRAYRRILAGGKKVLVPGGVLVVEISPEVSEKVQELAEGQGYRQLKIERDLSGMERMLVLAPR